MNQLQITLDEIKVHLADAVLETHVLRREVNRLAKENAELKKLNAMLSEQLPNAAE